MSTSTSLDSERGMAMPYWVDVVRIKRSGSGRRDIMQLEYCSGMKVKVRDLAATPTYQAWLHGGLDDLQGGQLRASIRKISEFVVAHSVRIEAGKTCINRLTGATTSLGVSSSIGLLYLSTTDRQAFGRIQASESQNLCIHVHIENSSQDDSLTNNCIVLRANTPYLVARHSQGAPLDPVVTQERTSRCVRLSWWREQAAICEREIDVTEDFNTTGLAYLQRKVDGSLETRFLMDVAKSKCATCRCSEGGFIHHLEKCIDLASDVVGPLVTFKVPEDALSTVRPPMLDDAFDKIKRVRKAVSLAQRRALDGEDVITSIAQCAQVVVGDVICILARAGTIRCLFRGRNLCYLEDEEMDGGIVQRSGIPARTLATTLWQVDHGNNCGLVLSRISGVSVRVTTSEGLWHVTASGT